MIFSYIKFLHNAWTGAASGSSVNYKLIPSFEEAHIYHVLRPENKVSGHKQSINLLIDLRIKFSFVSKRMCYSANARLDLLSHCSIPEIFLLLLYVFTGDKISVWIGPDQPKLVDNRGIHSVHRIYPMLRNITAAYNNTLIQKHDFCYLLPVVKALCARKRSIVPRPLNSVP
jgi:hypothetical protein